MQQTHHGLSLIVMKLFSSLCQERFGSGGGHWKCERREDELGFPLFDITTKYEEEEQIMQKVLGYANGEE